MADLPPPKKESSILSSQEQTLRLARSRGIDGMLTRNTDSTFEQRATFRHLTDQAARQRNLEAIMVMASRHCEETAAGGEMDSDWLTRFLQLAEDISMVPMQQLWGRIFALEVATPGRFSIRALATLKEMTQREAQLFQRICSLTCHYTGSDEQRLLLGLHKGASLLSRAKATRLGPMGSSWSSATSAGGCSASRTTSPCSTTGSPLWATSSPSCCKSRRWRNTCRI